MSIEDRNQQLNETLDNRYDQLNAAIERAEQVLKGMRLPGDIECVYASWDNDPYAPEYQEYASIGMIKINGTWRLSIGYSDDLRPDPNWKPLRDATAQERLQAIQHFDKLRQKIVEEKEKLIPKVEQAITSVVTLLDAWEQDGARNE